MATWAQLVAESLRIGLTTALEEALGAAGFAPVAGVDEAGRGALAGPLVAAAVVPDPRRRLPGVDDSKRLSPESRERLAELIRRHAIATEVAAVPPEVVDRLNVLEATRIAMQQALSRLAVSPLVALVDAVPLPRARCRCLAVVRGDCLSYAVACASIVAKVERDRLMRELDVQHPQYGFSEHKGYGSERHLATLREYGPSPAHRLTFRGVLPGHGEEVA